jgi:hypothetical protein
MSVAIAICEHGIPWAAYVKGYGTSEQVEEMVWSLRDGDRIEIKTAVDFKATVSICDICD